MSEDSETNRSFEEDETASESDHLFSPASSHGTSIRTPELVSELESEFDDFVIATPTSPSTSSSTAAEDPLPLTGDLFAKDAKFDFVWFVANGGLKNGSKRRASMRKILAFDAITAWKDVERYVPRKTDRDGMTIHTLIKVQVLFSGILMLATWKLQYHQRDVRKFIAELEKGKRIISFAPNLADEGFVDQLIVDPAPPAPGVAQARTPRNTKRGKKAPPALPTSPPESERETPEAEVSTRVARKRRRVLRAEALSDTQIMRMLTDKMTELQGNQIVPNANNIVDPILPEADPPLDTTFYSGIHEDVNLVQDQSTYIEEFNALGAETGNEPLDPADVERNEARATSVRSPTVYIDAQNMPPQTALSQVNSFPTLAPVRVPNVTPRRGRRRRLVFCDDSTQITQLELQSQVAESRVELATLFMVVTESRFQSPSLIRFRKQGIPFIEESGRKMIGNELGAMVRGNCRCLPLSRSYDEVERELTRAQQSTVGANTGVSALGEPSGAEATGNPELDNASIPSAAMIGEDISDTDIPQPPPPQGGLLNEVEYSVVFSPRVSTTGDRGILPMDMDVATMDEVALEPPGVNPARVKLVPFTEIVPHTTKRRLAARIFFGLLKHQAEKNLELIQEEFYKEIQIRILKANVDPSQDSVLTEGVAFV